jgi:hypothetical protein
MEDEDETATFNHYAKECRRLAKAMPEHCDTLLEIAEAWDACARNAPRRETKIARTN